MPPIEGLKPPEPASERPLFGPGGLLPFPLGPNGWQESPIALNSDYLKKKKWSVIFKAIDV